MTAADEAPVLHSPVSLRQRSLWLGELALYEDRLTISGWKWTGAVVHPVPIAEIRKVEKRRTLPRFSNFVIRPAEHRDFYCQIEDSVFYWVKEFRDDDRMDLEVRH